MSSSCCSKRLASNLSKGSGMIRNNIDQKQQLGYSGFPILLISRFLFFFPRFLIVYLILAKKRKSRNLRRAKGVGTLGTASLGKYSLFGRAKYSRVEGWILVWGPNPNKSEQVFRISRSLVGNSCLRYGGPQFACIVGMGLQGINFLFMVFVLTIFCCCCC